MTLYDKQEPGLGGRRPAAALVAGRCSRRALAGAGRLGCRACCGRCWASGRSGARPSRVLLIGDVRRPRVTVTTFVSGDAVRVVLEASEKVPFRVSQEDRRVTVAIAARRCVDVALQPGAADRRHRGPRPVPGRTDNLFAIDAGPALPAAKASEQEAPAAAGARVPGRAAGGRGRAARRRRPPAPPLGRPPAEPRTGGLRTVVIDPGHGGARSAPRARAARWRRT